MICTRGIGNVNFLSFCIKATTFTYCQSQSYRRTKVSTICEKSHNINFQTTTGLENLESIYYTKNTSLRKFTSKMGSINRIDNTILLFDVDGTLTKSRQLIEPEVYNFLVNEVKPKIKVGLVGGSDLCKIIEQLGVGKRILDELDYVFAENGLVAYENGKLIGTESIQKFIGEEKVQKFINFCLGYMSKLELPVKRGTFIEFRNGMINICPVGRSCSQEERNQFSEYDQKHKIREKFVEAMRSEFPDYGLKISIGGQISIDAFPVGWDKTFCLKYLNKISTIHFFGDKILPGGNDHEIYEDNRTIGHAVTNPQDTIQQVREILKSLEASNSN